MKTWKMMMAMVLCCGLVCSFGILGCGDDDDDNGGVALLETDCDDGLDDDGDGCIDGADADCGGIETDCENLVDDDCDDLLDEADIDDCAGGLCFIVTAS